MAATEQSDHDHATQQIVSQILPLGIANAADILNAIHQVADNSNVEHIINYLLETPNKRVSDEQVAREPLDDEDLKDNNDEFEFADDDEYEYEYVYEEVEVEVEVESEELEQEQKPTDFMWRCHKCETWFLHSEQGLCTNCVQFKLLPSSCVRPGVFQYRPGPKSDLLVCGYIGSINGRDIGMEIISNLILSFLRPPTYDEWVYPLLSYHRHGKDISVNALNQRVQYRADPDLDQQDANGSAWRTVFGFNAIPCDMSFCYRFEAVHDIKNMMIGLVYTQQATLKHAVGNLWDIGCCQGTLCQFSATDKDVIEMRVNASKCSVEYVINGYEIKQSEINIDNNSICKLAVSLCRKYDGIEMIEFVRM